MNNTSETVSCLCVSECRCSLPEREVGHHNPLLDAVANLAIFSFSVTVGMNFQCLQVFFLGLYMKSALYEGSLTKTCIRQLEV